MEKVRPEKWQSQEAAASWEPEGGSAVVVFLSVGFPLEAACNNLTEQM